jgi:putative DNA primase/helicase
MDEAVFESAERGVAKVKPENGRPRRRSAPVVPQGGDPHLTDMGNAQRFVQDHGADIRYCWPWRTWLDWDGKRWRRDELGRAMASAKQTVGSMYDTAAAQLKGMRENHDLQDGERTAVAERVKQLVAHAAKSEDARALGRLLDLARSETGIPIMPETLDTQPWLLNVLNGTIDLHIGEIRPHCKDDYLTRLAPVTFDPKAKCPRWDNFLSEIFDYSEALMGYLQRLVGYWLTGLTTEHALPVLYGTGANGKTTLIGTLFDLLGGDFSGKASRDLLLAVRGDKHPTCMAWLHGKRFVAAIETAEGARLDEALVKELTGGDPITARLMRQDFWTFLPTHKLALVTNHKPTVRGTDHAIWRRLRLIPFNVCFTPDKQDKELPAKLRAELPGILNWAIDGCLTWKLHGLADPQEVLAATEEYRTAEDRLGTFLTERCIKGPDYRVKMSELWAAFKEWSETGGEDAGTKTAFGLRISERGFERDSGRRWYVGITLRNAEADE